MTEGFKQTAEKLIAMNELLATRITACKQLNINSRFWYTKWRQNRNNFYHLIMAEANKS